MTESPIPASESPSSRTADRFLVARDWWDTLYFFTAQIVQSECRLLWYVGFIAVVVYQLMLFFRPSSLIIWLTLAGVIVYTQVIVGLMRGWRHRSERFNLTDTELCWHIGYMTIIFPIETITRVQPMGVVRGLFPVRRGARVWFNQPPFRVYHGPSVLSRWVRFFSPIEIAFENVEYPKPLGCSIDFAPSEVDRFIEEISSRISTSTTPFGSSRIPTTLPAHSLDNTTTE